MQTITELILFSDSFELLLLLMVFQVECAPTVEERVADYMLAHPERGLRRGSFITGVAVCTTHTLNDYGVTHNLFYHLENEGLLQPDNHIHLFSLHYTYLPRINSSLRAFAKAWNRHPMQSERGLSPQQLWVAGLAHYQGDTFFDPVSFK